MDYGYGFPLVKTYTYLKENFIVVAENMVPQPFLVLADLCTFGTFWSIPVVMFFDTASAYSDFVLFSLR